MPLLANLWKVGAALLSILFVADYCLPRAPIREQTSSDFTELPVNRMDSATVANALAMLPRPNTRPPESINRRRQPKISSVAAGPRRHVKPQMLLAARQVQFTWLGFRFL